MYFINSLLSPFSQRGFQVTVLVDLYLSLFITVRTTSTNALRRLCFLQVSREQVLSERMYIYFRQLWSGPGGLKELHFSCCCFFWRIGVYCLYQLTRCTSFIGWQFRMNLIKFRVICQDVYPLWKQTHAQVFYGVITYPVQMSAFVAI